MKVNEIERDSDMTNKDTFYRLESHTRDILHANTLDAPHSYACAYRTRMRVALIYMC